MQQEWNNFIRNKYKLPKQVPRDFKLSTLIKSAQEQIKYSKYESLRLLNNIYDYKSRSKSPDIVAKKAKRDQLLELSKNQRNLRLKHKPRISQFKTIQITKKSSINSQLVAQDTIESYTLPKVVIAPRKSKNITPIPNRRIDSPQSGHFGFKIDQSTNSPTIVDENKAIKQRIKHLLTKKVPKNPFS